MSNYTCVVAASALPPGRSMCVEFSGERVALFNLGGTIHAISDTCTHVGGPLSEGAIEGGVVRCPWHGACFDIASGQMLGPPARAHAKRYGVRVSNGEIQLAP